MISPPVSAFAQSRTGNSKGRSSRCGRAAFEPQARLRRVVLDGDDMPKYSAIRPKRKRARQRVVRPFQFFGAINPPFAGAAVT